MGFTSSNDRGFINVLKKLQFLNSDGVPSAYYSDLRDQNRAKKMIARQIKEYYRDLFAINTNMNSAGDDEIISKKFLSKKEYEITKKRS